MTDNKNSIIGYMNGLTGPTNNINVLITIEILPDAITDIERDDIIDTLNARYTTDTIKLIKIIDEQLNEYCICTINGYEHKVEIVYKIGDMFIFNEFESYNFYFSKKRTIYGIYKYNNVGFITTYYDNGQKEEEYFLTAKRDRHGNSKYWTKRGDLILDINYSNSSLDGEYKKWHVNYNYDEDEESQYKPKLFKHILYLDGHKVEYLNSELAIEKINKIYDNEIKYINKILNVLYPTTGFDKTIKFKKSAKKNKYHVFTQIIELSVEVDVKLNKVISKNIDVIAYNNLKKTDLMKKLYDVINNEYVKSCINVHNEIKQDVNKQLDNYYITQFNNKTKVGYQEFKVFFSNMKQILSIY